MKTAHRIALVTAIFWGNGSLAENYSTGLIVPEDAEYGVPYLSWPTGTYDLPERLDLRDEGLITGVKNQGSCGSCWAFAGAATMESAVLKATQSTFDLSEQELVSCDKSASGCSGGWQPFDYMVKNGIGLEEGFPYAGRNLSCKKIPAAAKALRWGNIGSPGRKPTVDEARKALNDFGALWVTVAANGYWRNVGGDSILRCSNSQINHAVTLAGYEPTQPSRKSKDGETEFRFLVKNSWGQKWATDGYVKTPLGCNNLGRHMSFVVPEGSTCTPPDFGLPKRMDASVGEVINVEGLEAANLSYTWRIKNGEVEVRGPLVIEKKGDADFVVTTRNACGIWSQMIRVVSK